MSLCGSKASNSFYSCEDEGSEWSLIAHLPGLLLTDLIFLISASLPCHAHQPCLVSLLHTQVLKYKTISGLLPLFLSPRMKSMLTAPSFQPNSTLSWSILTFMSISELYSLLIPPSLILLYCFQPHFSWTLYYTLSSLLSYTLKNISWKQISSVLCSYHHWASNRLAHRV